MLCGIWLLGFLLVVHVTGMADAVTYKLLLFGLLTTWGGHVVAPMIAAWRSNILRDELWKSPAYYVALPVMLMIGFGIIGALTVQGSANAYPYLMSNYRFTGFGAAMFLIFVAWNTWHFASQHFGVLSIYRVRAKQFDDRDRRWDRIYAVGMTCGLMPIAWYTQGRRLGVLNEVFELPNPHGALAMSVVAVSMVITAIALAYEFRKPNRSLPRLLYIVSIGIQPVFAVVSYTIYHFAVFSMAHWIVAIALVARVWSNEAASHEVERPNVWTAAQRMFAFQVMIMIGVSVVFYFVWRSSVIPHFADWAAVRLALSGDGSYGLRAMGAVGGALLGLNITHFMYDRFIYSFRRPAIRQAIAPYLFQEAR